MLAVAVAIVAAPTGTVGGIDFEEGVGEQYAAGNQRVVAAAQTEPHELQKIDAELPGGGQPGVERVILYRLNAIEGTAIAR